MCHSSRLSLSATNTTKATRRQKQRTKIATSTSSTVERGYFRHNNSALVTFLLLWTMILLVHESIVARVMAFYHHYPTLSNDTQRRLRLYVYHRWVDCCGYYNRHYHDPLDMIRTEPAAAVTTTWMPHRNIASTTTRSIPITISSSSSSVRLYSSSSKITTRTHIESLNHTYSDRRIEFSTDGDDDNWVQWIYDAFREYETDGIIQLGTTSDATDKDDTVATIMLEARKNPMDHLSAPQLWQMTLVAARRIALDTKQVSRNVSHSDNGRFVPGTGIAASMLNGWIAAAVADRCSGHGDRHHSLQQQQHQQQYRIQYAQELFRIATMGHDAITGRTGVSGKTQAPPPTTRNSPSKPDKKNEKKNETTLIVVEPDLVTYSLLYTLLHPTNPILAESYLQLAQRQSKKTAGTQRRKLLSKASSLRPKDGVTTFRDYEKALQELLSPTENTTTTVDGDNHSNEAYSRKDDALILYENENYIVINKPSGTCCYHTHTTTAGKRNVDLSLVDALQKFRSSANSHQTSLSTLNPVALGIVHRLDRGTSGCMVIAKNDPTHARFVAAMFQRQFRKTYTVLVSPAPCTESYHETTGYITIPVDGKPAKSKYTVIERFVRYNAVSHRNETAALMNVTTYTGRQHQVRVHCSYGLGSPIIGDTLYSAMDDSKIGNTIKHRINRKDISRIQNDKLKERFHLHASTISIPDHEQWTLTVPEETPTWSTRPTMTYDAPIPTWWQPVLDAWRHAL